MQIVSDDLELLLQEMRVEEYAAEEIGNAADEYARAMENITIDIDDLDPVACPPDRRVLMGDREAWIYEHGNISELIFVNVS